MLNWNSFARNEYSIIPITLDDYKLKIEVVDYPPIGVYPAAVTGDEGSFTCTFHAGSDFQIIPTLTKYSDGNTADFTIESITQQSNPSIPAGFFEKEPTIDANTGQLVGIIGDIPATALYLVTIKVSATGRQLNYILYLKR